MKPKRLAILSLALLATMILGTGAIIALSANDIKANVKWYPRSYTFDNPPPDPWLAQLQLVAGHHYSEVDEATILLDGMYSPSGAMYPAPHGPKAMVPFDGLDVKLAIEPKLPWHMGVVMPGKYRIDLEITGNLLPEYGEEPFRGTGVITVTVSESPG
jgi:hypothetical protein